MGSSGYLLFGRDGVLQKLSSSCTIFVHHVHAHIILRQKDQASFPKVVIIVWNKPELSADDFTFFKEKHSKRT